MRLGALWILVSAFAASAHAETGIVEFSGRLSLEGHWYPETGAHPGQRAHASGFVPLIPLYALVRLRLTPQIVIYYIDRQKR